MYCVWQVVKTLTIIFNNPVYSGHTKGLYFFTSPLRIILSSTSGALPLISFKVLQLRVKSNNEPCTNGLISFSLVQFVKLNFSCWCVFTINFTDVVCQVVLILTCAGCIINLNFWLVSLEKLVLSDVTFIRRHGRASLGDWCPTFQARNVHWIHVVSKRLISITQWRGAKFQNNEDFKYTAKKAYKLV